MSTPSPTPIQTQTPLPPLARALNLLDGLLLRDDVPLDARLDITEVFADLLDVRPPFPPTVPDPGVATGPWTAVAAQAEAALWQLTKEFGVNLPPAVVLGYALAARSLRGTLAQQNPATS